MKTLGCLLKYRSMRVFYDQCTSRYRTTIPPSVFLHQNITIPQIGKPFSISRFRGYFDVGKHGIHRLNDCSEIRFQCILLYVSFYFNYGFPLEYNSWSQTYFKFWLRIRHLFFAISRKHSELDKGDLYQISLAAADYFCNIFSLLNFYQLFKFSFLSAKNLYELLKCLKIATGISIWDFKVQDISYKCCLF